MSSKIEDYDYDYYLLFITLNKSIFKNKKFISNIIDKLDRIDIASFFTFLKYRIWSEHPIFYKPNSTYKSC
jgi:hypothetical protein